jgi:hypothetical protein
MAGPQRGTSARGKRQGVLERAKKYYGETGLYDPSKINQFAGRGIVDKYVELPSDKRRVLNTDRRTMSEEDSSLADKAELAGKALYLSKLLKEDPGMYRRIVQGDMDEAMRDGAKRFERSSESDSPGYKKGGSLPDLTGDGKVTRADVLKGRGVFRKGGSVKSSASRRADGIAQRGKTRGKFV